MGRQRKPSAKALAASEVVPFVAKTESLIVKKEKIRAKPPVAPNSPLPVLNVPETRQDAPIQSEYEEVPAGASFQPLSAATINSSPCKAMPARGLVSPLRMASKNSPRTSPSILRKRSFDGRIQQLCGNDKLPSLECVAPPVIKPEMVEEAKFLQAARALQRYASSENEDSDDGESFEQPSPKRVRTGCEGSMDRGGRRSLQSCLGKEANNHEDVENPVVPSRRGSLSNGTRRRPEWQDGNTSEHPISETEPRAQTGSKVRDVLLAMAEIAQPCEAKEHKQEESALSILRSASSNHSRPSSTELEGVSQDTMSPKSEKEVSKDTVSNGTSDVDLTMVSLLSELKGSV